MDDLLACRVCLIMDVKMYNLRSSPLDDYFRSIFGVNPHTHKFLTQVCVECAVLIKKFYMFREKCLRGINILQDMLTNNEEITRLNFEEIDRKHLKLTSTFSVGLPQNNYYFLLDHGEELLPLNNKDYIKEERDLYNGCNKMTIKVELEDLGRDQDDDMSDEDDKKIIEFKVPVSSKLKSKEIQKPEVKRKTRALTLRQSKPSSNIKAIAKTVDKKISKLTGVTRTSKTKVSKVQKVRIRKKPKANPRSESDPDTKRTEIVQSLDKEISNFYDVITRTLEEQKADIKERQHTLSYQNASLKCNVCFKIFVHQKAYDLHMKKHDPSAGPVMCEVCGFRYRNRKGLVKHRSFHMYRFVCKLCPRILLSRPNAESHQIWHSGMKFDCKHCSETFTHPTSYLNHLRIKHPSNHICNLCGYSYLTVQGLKQHKSRMHKEDMECELSGPNCDKCDIQFLNQQAFERHLVNSSNHISEKANFSTSCRQCGEIFTDSDLMKAHRREQHPRERPVKTAKFEKIEWPRKCDHCDAMIPTAKENWYHHQRDHREKEYIYTAGDLHICEICGYKTANSVYLTYHVKEKHSGHHPYACPHCAKTFGTPHKYKMHLRTHSDQKPYSCSICSWSFKTKNYLLRHQKTHSGLRPHSCPICHKTFGTTTARNSHVKYVHYKAPPPVRKKKLSHLKAEKMEETLGE